MTGNANYLPDEILLEVLAYIEAWDIRSKQSTLANFSYVNRCVAPLLSPPLPDLEADREPLRQWYDVAIQPLYDSPYLTGRAYELFVRTICPSVLAHIKKQNLANLVRVLDLSHIIHQGTKSTTARLLGRTKAGLQIFIAPQA